MSNSVRDLRRFYVPPVDEDNCPTSKTYNKLRGISDISASSDNYNKIGTLLLLEHFKYPLIKHTT